MPSSDCADPVESCCSVIFGIERGLWTLNPCTAGVRLSSTQQHCHYHDRFVCSVLDSFPFRGIPWGTHCNLVPSQRKPHARLVRQLPVRQYNDSTDGNALHPE